MHDSDIQSDNDLSLAEMICARCKEPIDALDRFCRHCGVKRGSKGALYHRPMVVLGLLFFVVGPLALPLLWRSETFTRNQKIAVTIVNLAFIGGIVLAMLAVFRAYMKMILELSMG